MLKERYKKYQMPTIYLALLVTIINICDVVIFKTISIHGIIISMSGIFFPFSFLILTALNESYGHKETEKAILMIIVAQSLFIILISISIRLPSNEELHTASLYFELYQNLWRLLISSSLAIVLSFYTSSFLNSKFKIWLLGRRQIIRFIIVNSIAKAVLVIIAYPANFYGVLSTIQIIKLTFDTWFFKVLVSIILAFVVRYLTNINKRVDKIDIYDFNTDYSPTKMFQEAHSGENMYGKKLY